MTSRNSMLGNMKEKETGLTLIAYDGEDSIAGPRGTPSPQGTHRERWDVYRQGFSLD